MKKKISHKDMELMLKAIQINNPGIDEEILKAFRICDRAFFVKEDPYLDEARHVAHGQTISQPSTVARMIRLLKLEKGLDVLEVGTNTGYHAALVAYLVYPGIVSTIEIFPDLAERAKRNIRALIRSRKKESKLFSKLKVFVGDALDQKTEIWKEKYDRIYFTAGVDSDKVDDVLRMGRQLLKDKGLLLFPTRESWDYGGLEIWQKRGMGMERVMKEMGYAFVPLLKKEELEEIYEKSEKLEKSKKKPKKRI